MTATVFGGVALLAGPAWSADPVEPLAYDWTGPYLGAHAGYGFGDGDARLDGLGGGNWDPFYPVALGNKDFSADGFIGGLQAGYNQQMDSFVFGIETDISFSDVGDKSSEVSPGGYIEQFTYSQEYDLDWFGTTRLRTGFAFDRAFIYATGGIAYGEVRVDHDMQFTPNRYHGSDSSWKIGWTLGGGMEYAVTENMSVTAQYLYFDLADTKSIADSVPLNAPFQQEFTSDNTGQIVTIGVNWKF